MRCLIENVDVYLLVHAIFASVGTLTFDLRSQNEVYITLQQSVESLPLLLIAKSLMRCLIVNVDVYWLVHAIIDSVGTLTFDLRSQKEVYIT